MKRKLLLGWVCVFGMMLFAQEDLIIMRINGKEITRSEFEYSYRHHLTDEDKKISPKEYAEIFIDKKLKVAAAKELGMDTTGTFRQQQKNNRAILLKSYLTDERLADSCARAYYEKLKVNGRPGQVQIIQIYKRLPQTATFRQLQIERERIDSIYQYIMNQPDIDFIRVAEQLSDDKQCTWLEGLQTTTEFEEIAFSLRKGEVSQPFFTPTGIHIVKVLDRRELPAYETIKDKLSERVKRGWSLDKGTGKVVDRLKKQCQYTANSSGIDELLRVGGTEKTLFTIDGKDFTGEMFKRFAVSYPQAIKRQLDGFIAKSILDYESQQLESRHPEINYALQELEQDVLVTQLIRQKIELPVMNDRAALATYFKFHQSDYRWETPRYKGIVLHCVDKKVAKQAKKLLKKMPEKEWKDILQKTFNTSDIEKIKVEQGLFADGDNKFIDKLVFKKGNFEPIVSYPFTVVVGRKMKGPDDYRIVIEQLRKDYRTYLDTCWTRELRGTGKVEINQEVLKTVNNN